MTEEMINLGEQYVCKPIGFTKTVVGEVVSKMTNCAVVKVAQCAAEDQELLDEKASMVVAKYDTFE
ncbi:MULTISPECIES: hypothetical protein [Enterococcus]|uniref:hypothetical protein n=1 Tax=Enterococcus TaxID=1350 RepID=UPI0022E7D388|nr:MULTISPECIES: hypothetical protein [Enterococcus]